MRYPALPLTPSSTWLIRRPLLTRSESRRPRTMRIRSKSSINRARAQASRGERRSKPACPEQGVRLPGHVQLQWERPRAGPRNRRRTTPRRSGARSRQRGGCLALSLSLIVEILTQNRSNNRSLSLSWTAPEGKDLVRLVRLHHDDTTETSPAFKSFCRLVSQPSKPLSCRVSFCRCSTFQHPSRSVHAAHKYYLKNERNLNDTYESMLIVPSIPLLKLTSSEPAMTTSRGRPRRTGAARPGQAVSAPPRSYPFVEAHADISHSRTRLVTVSDRLHSSCSTLLHPVFFPFSSRLSLSKIHPPSPPLQHHHSLKYVSS